nr:PREDICTED: glutamyl-tRNA(Gln) amidotransferase subunit B, mitochondrial [Megachile rotundata]
MFVYSKNYMPIVKYYKDICKKFHLRFASTDLNQWKPTIGLEIHAQIATKSKLFSGASTNFQSPINSCVSLFDCATPGTMPVLNKKCVEAGILTALALSCKVNDVSMFERKHYFYSDLPAGYQITQQKKPLAVNGEIKFVVPKPEIKGQHYLKSSKIKQIQLEQDSGRSFYNELTERNLIDLNRAGIPLMELVLEPDLTTGEEAAALVRELSFILQLIGTCSCKMEEGALRVDANVSVSQDNASLGTRTEIKNIGSIHAIANAIRYEIGRHITILKKGGQIVNETRAWDPECKKTIPMREKEEKHDYRFMPEPNLPPLYLHVNENMENKYNLIDVTSLRQHLPELPEQMRQGVLQNLTPPTYVGLTTDIELFNIFRNILEHGKHRNPQLVAYILISDITGFVQKHNLEMVYCINHLSYIGELIDLIQDKRINYLILRKLLVKLLDGQKKTAKQIVEENNWFMISDVSELENVCLEVLKNEPKLVKKYKAGRSRVFKVFLQKVATATNDCADMQQATKILTRLLS